jgi:hypothetical protein
LFWDESINVSLLSKGERYIDVVISEAPDATPWRATFVYGEPRVEKKKDMWDLMRTLCGEWLGPWTLMGDFNEAMWQYEHFSETPRSERQMMDFREVLSHCDLYDLGFSGLPWTYNKNQRGTQIVRVRLDRGVENSDWMLMWPSTNVIHLTSPQSDHKAFLVEVRSGSETLHQHRVFRYVIMWEREETLSSVVEKAWQRKNPGSDLGALAERLQVVTKDLKAWSRSNFWQITKQLEELHDEVVSLECDDPIRNWDAILTAKKKLDELLYREEMMWLQRSRVNWLKEGD